MDPAEPVFQDLLVEQAARHMDLPSFEGIAVDRLDYSEFYNLHADDGVSWVPGFQCKFICTSYKLLALCTIIHLRSSG